jgi:hypothetical protein
MGCVRFLYGDYANSALHLVEIVEALASSLKGKVPLLNCYINICF